ncbi:uncharacterized protein BP5553_04833 [Venustampulla echinocandica]|uniref:Uncharacterized protein n=1 Tax=Venustampulla echinocandica TaxID=2656787 RepID=A0A370TPE2_9HELO|nr:uncharacterized protein BP5553_04833 [Venustampulla echinocandica]RDL37400.1 hypothetical protein BP5553_04833 [Venustampulla echinocandica]
MCSNTPFATLSPTKVQQLRTGRIAKNIFSVQGLDSAILKIALPSKPVYLGHLGLPDDEHAFHTHGGPDKALMHYAAGHYDKWRKELPGSVSLLTYGAFGENLLTDPADGYNEQTVCIGDIFAIGNNGAQIQVTQPRQPCYKLNHRLEVKDMAMRSQTECRTGWHNRVLVPGFITPGDSMQLIERKHPDWPIRRVQRYLYDERHNMEIMRGLMEMEALAEETRGIFRKRVQKGEYRNEDMRLIGDDNAALKWNTYRLAGKIKETDAVSSFIFEAVDKFENPVQALPGAHIRVKLGPKSGNLVRAYSVVEGDSNGFRLGIVHDARSRGGSKFLHENLELGEELVFSNMASDFPLVDGTLCDEHIFLSGGIGITAFFTSAKLLKEQGRSVALYYAVKRAADVGFKDILQTLEDKVKLCVSEKGSKINIANILNNANDRTHIYVCGPDRLLDAVKETARTIGFPQSNIHSEAFVISTGGDPFTVQIESQCKELQVREGETLLDVLREAGFDIPSNCEVGNCGTCRVGVKQGRVQHRGTGLLGDDKKSMMLSCVSRGVDTLALDL